MHQRSVDATAPHQKSIPPATKAALTGEGARRSGLLDLDLVSDTTGSAGSLHFTEDVALMALFASGRMPVTRPISEADLASLGVGEWGRGFEDTRVRLESYMFQILAIP